MATTAKIIAANDLAIKAATCGTHKVTGDPAPAEYKIEGIDRIVLRVQPSGVKTFWMRYSVAGEDKRVKLGKYPANSLREVRTKAAEINASLERGDDPHAVKEVARGKVTVGELWQHWLAAHQPPRRAQNTINYYEMALVEVWPEIGRDEMAGDVTPVRVAALVRKVTAKSRAKGHAVRSVLATMFRFGVPDLVPTNPVRDVRSPQASKREKRDRVASAEEVGRLWNALEDGKGMEVRTAIALKLLILTAQRNDQVAGSKVSEFPAAFLSDDATALDPVWTIPKERMKKERAQHVSLTARTEALWRAALKVRASDEDVIGYDYRVLTRAMKRLTTKLKIDDLHIHDMRHAFTTWAVDNGIGYDIRTRVTAHTSADVNSRVYDKAKMTEQVRDALSRWEQYVMACAEIEARKALGDASSVVRLRA